MDNLVERLRDLAHSRDCMGYDATAEKMREAADRIEMLEKALREIAAEAWVSLSDLPPFDSPNGWRKIATDRIDIARKALEAKP